MLNFVFPHRVGNPPAGSTSSTSATPSDGNSTAPSGGANTTTTPAQPGPIPANAFAGLFAGVPSGQGGGGATWQNDMAQMLRGVMQQGAVRSLTEFQTFGKVF